MIKNIIYLRQSLDVDKQPHSLDMQLSACLEYAKKNQWVVHEIYNEGQRSARKTSLEDRPELMRLLNDVKNGQIGRVLVFKRDRFARNVQQYIGILREFRLTDVEIYFAADNEPPLFEGAVSEFIEAILAGVAQYEAENIVRRLIESRLPLMKEGRWGTGTPPYGYETVKSEGTSKKEKGIIRKIPKKVSLVIKLFREFVSLSPIFIKKADFALICKELRKDKDFQELSNKQIWTILKQPLYKGEMVQRLAGHEIIVERLDLQIIDVKVWNEANELLKEIQVPSYFYSSANRDLEEDDVSEYDFPLLTHRLFCGNEGCGKPLIPKKKVYQCSACKNSPRIRKVDDEVIKKLLLHLLAKAQNDWGKVKRNLVGQFVKPIHRYINNTESEIQHLEQEIKKAFSIHMVNSSNESNVALENLIKRYKEKAKLHDVLNNRFFHLKEFLDSLNKNEILERIEGMDLDILQKQHLLSLVKSVHYSKRKASNVVIYKIEEGDSR